MNLTKQTIDVLHNFASINSNMFFKKGNVVRTLSDSSAIVGRAEIDIEIPQDFGIYDLNEFLGVIRLVDNPILNFKNDYVQIEDGSGRSRTRYYFTDSAMLKYPPKDITMPETVVSFKLDEDTMAKLSKAASTLKYSEIIITPNDGINLAVSDSESATSHTYSIDVPGEYDKSVDFKFIVDIGNLKMMSGDYEVTISEKFISQFRNTENNTTYWVAMEKSSTYN